MSNYVIAVDTLGGDPYVIGLDGKPVQQPVVERAVKGSLGGLSDRQNFDLVLIGNGDEIQKELDKYDVKIPVHIEPSGTFFDSYNPRSSLQILLDGIGKDFDGGLTIGDTTKIIQHIGGKLHDLAMPNVEQLPLAAFISVREGMGSVLYLDMGANMVCRPNHLYQFAHMARIIVNEREGVIDPKIGILTVGSEVYKGNKLVRRTMELCKAAGLDVINISRAEPRDAEVGNVDAVVTDGHTGNLLLKGVEAKAETILGHTKTFLAQNIEGILRDYQTAVETGHIKPTPELDEVMKQVKNIPSNVLGRLIKRFAFESYGAATLCGLQSRTNYRAAILKKGHGISDDYAFERAVIGCRGEIMSALTEKMQKFFTNEYKLPKKKRA